MHFLPWSISHLRVLLYLEIFKSINVSEEKNQGKYLLEEMLLPTHGSVAEYHSVSTANALKTPHLPSFKRCLFKGSSSVGL